MKKVALLLEEGYEDLEYWYPKLRLQEAGFEVETLHATVGFKCESKHGYPAEASTTFSQAKAEEFSGVVIPGGWAPDRLRTEPEVLSFVRDIHGNGGVIGSICHAGSVLVSANIVEGKNVTSYHAIKDDLIAAGANWEDCDVICDAGIVTSRTPKDLPVFMKAIIGQLEEG